MTTPTPLGFKTLSMHCAICAVIFSWTCKRLANASTTRASVLMPTPMGGQNKVVEVDETYVGGKAKNRKNHIPPKEAVVTLVERDAGAER